VTSFASPVDRFLAMARKAQAAEMDETAFWKLQVAARDALMAVDTSSTASARKALEDILTILQGLLGGTSASLVIPQKGAWTVAAAVGSVRPGMIGQIIDPASDRVSARVIREKRPFYFAAIGDVGEVAPARPDADDPSEIFCSFPVLGVDRAALGVINVSGIADAHPLFADTESSIDGALAAVAVKIAKLNKNAQALREKRRLTTALKSLDEARENETLKERLMFMMVHDLKNPLSLVIANLAYLDEMELPDEARELVALSRFGGERLMDMIKSSLDSYRIQSGRMRLTRGPFDLAEHLRRMVEEFGASARYDDIVVAYDGPESLPIVADEGIVRRILSNLLDNALRHAPLGGAVTVTLRKDGERATFAVADNGDGIDEADQEALFDAFAQTGDGAARGGYGLGLAFCRMAAASHGGSVALESRPGEGARFIVTLPLAPAEEEPPTTPA
jgi:signal transduction histidine kinase